MKVEKKKPSPPVLEGPDEEKKENEIRTEQRSRAEK